MSGVEFNCRILPWVEVEFYCHMLMYSCLMVAFGAFDYVDLPDIILNKRRVELPGGRCTCSSTW